MPSISDKFVYLKDYFGAKVVGLQPLHLNSRKSGNAQKSLKSSLEEMEAFAYLSELAVSPSGYAYGPLDKRPLSSIGSPKKRALSDSIEGTGFGGLDKRALGDIEGIGFGGLEKRSKYFGENKFYKRALGDIEGTGFDDLEKRALEDIEGIGFGGLEKRALGDIEGTGFGGLEKRFIRTGKRALDALDQKGFNGLDKRSLKVEPAILRFFSKPLFLF
uniref:Orcokinin peptides type B n=1 Tax=Syphacia muris TaxID=451379 RepID=A0A0N5AL65_9BILA